MVIPIRASFTVDSPSCDHAIQWRDVTRFVTFDVQGPVSPGTIYAGDYTCPSTPGVYEIDVVVDYYEGGYGNFGEPVHFGYLGSPRIKVRVWNPLETPDATFTEQQKAADSWTEQQKATDSWTEQQKTSDSFSEQQKTSDSWDEEP
jgi:hypothetical protein